MLPRIIIHVGMSVDGRIDWGTGDMGLYYELASHWQADAMLSGSGTMLAASIPEETPPEYQEAAERLEGDKETRQWLVVVDSRGRLRTWDRIKKQPWWRDGIALCSHATPKGYLAYLEEQQVDYIVSGDAQVDLRVALQELTARYGIKRVRVDSGGILNGVLLRANLVNEVSVLIYPELVGGTTPRSIFVAPDLTGPEGIIKLRLLHVENVRDSFVWLRYEVIAG